MTENEAINYLRQIDPKHIECVELIDMKEVWENIPQAISIAEKALKEIQQYRAIGTVEECREARERQRGKKPIMKPFYKDMEEEYLCCPACGDILTDRIPMDNKDFYFHCLNCGQNLDWSE